MRISDWSSDGSSDLPDRGLAGALRHRAGGRPAVSADAAAGLGAGAGGTAGRAGALATSRQLLPAVVPVPADGPERRVPDRRPVQPVRVLRSAAGGILRAGPARFRRAARSEEHTSELQSLMRISYAVFCLK